MFGGVLGLLAELAAAAPVLLVLEDLHWADASTRDLVTFLSRMLHRERVALIGTYRTDDLHRRHPLRPVVAELLRLPSVIAVDLAPLDPSALAEHLTAALAGSDGRIDATALNDIVARAEGNAYYAEELLAASVERGPPGAQPARRAGGAAAQPGGAAVRRRPAGAPRGGGGRPQGRRRAGPGRVGPGGRPSTRPRCGRRSRTSCSCPTARRATSSGTPCCARPSTGTCCPGERTRLHGTMSALLAEEQRLAMPGTAAELAQHCLASHDIPGAFAASIRAGEEAERLGAPGRGAPALRPGARPVGAGGRAGEDGRHGPRQAGPAVRDQRGRQRRRRARRAPAPAAAARARRAGRPGRAPAPRRQPGQPDRRAPRLLPDGRSRTSRPPPRPSRWPGPRWTRRPREPADLAVRPGDGHLRQHPAGRRRLRPGPGAGRARARRGPRRRGALGGGRRAGHPGLPQQPRRPQRRGHQAADRGAQAGPRGQGARRGAARRVPPGAGAPGARRPGHRRDRGARGHQAGQPDRARPGAVRQGRAAPALPVPLRRRQVGPRAGDRGRLPGPGHQRARGLPVLDGPVHRRRARQPGRGRAAGLDRAVPGAATASTGSSRAGCSPSTPSGRATPSRPWPRRGPRSASSTSRPGVTIPRPSGRPWSR